MCVHACNRRDIENEHFTVLLTDHKHAEFDKLFSLPWHMKISMYWRPQRSNIDREQEREREEAHAARTHKTVLYLVQYNDVWISSKWLWWGIKTLAQWKYVFIVYLAFVGCCWCRHRFLIVLLLLFIRSVSVSVYYSLSLSTFLIFIRSIVHLTISLSLSISL